MSKRISTLSHSALFPFMQCPNSRIGFIKLNIVKQLSVAVCIAPSNMLEEMDLKSIRQLPLSFLAALIGFALTQQSNNDMEI